MSSNEIEEKTKSSLRIQVVIVVFLLMFIYSSLLIILLHVFITSRSLDNPTIIQLQNTSDIQKIVNLLKDVVIKNFWSSLLWILLINALVDLVIAYVVSVWISRPVEYLLSNINSAYMQGIPYVSLNDNKFKEIQEISDVVSNMTSKYVNALDLQNLFIQDISHELKTPLAAVKSTGDLINMNDKPTLEDYKYYFQTSQVMNHRMINLVNQLTISNKSDAEIYDNENFNFSNTIKDVIKTHTPQIEEKKLKIHFDIENDIHMKGSAKYLSIAISNLLDNAIKYSDKENGVIEVNLKRRRGNIILEIADQGIGVSEADLKNIFDRFYRGENTQEINGTGLGLSIARKIIKAHNGKITMRSKLGMGSQINVTF